MLAERWINLSGRPAVVLPVQPIRCAVAGSLGLLIAAALMIVARRAAGALEQPLEPATLVLTGTLTAAAAIGVRLGWFASPTAHRGPLDWAVMVLTSLAVVLMGLGLCVSDTSAAALVTFWLLLAGEEGGAWHLHWKRGRESFLTTITRNPPPATSSSGPSVLPRDSSDPFFASDEITQQLTRSRAADGAEQLAGWLRIRFAASQRTGSIHVAFCPPFPVAPELEVAQIDGPDVRIKTAQRQPYGVRLDLKLAAAAEEPAAVLLQFSARTREGLGIGD